MNKLNPKQIARIEYLSLDEWVVDSGNADDEAKTWANFHRTLNMMSSIELHHFACNFNWDCGGQELAALINHPECDAGTALMVYWLGQPAEHYHSARLGRQLADANDTIALLRQIESRLQNDEFRYHDISCDPTNIMGHAFATGTKREREVVPDIMFNKIDGVVVQPHLC